MLSVNEHVNGPFVDGKHAETETGRMRCVTRPNHRWRAHLSIRESERSTIRYGSHCRYEV